MTLPELSVKRHVLAWMLSGVMVLFGLIAYQRIALDRFPAIEFPVISITTTLKGANPDVVDTSITSILESAVNTMPGLEHVQSASSPGVSVITLTFKLEKNIDQAYTEVQSKVNQAVRRLPQETDPPVLRKAETNDSPIYWLALHGDRTVQQLNLYALNVLKKKLETIDGVGEVLLGGRRDRTIRVEFNTERMAAYGLTVNDLLQAFSREHVQVPGGFLVQAQSEKMLKLDMEFHRVNELESLIVANRKGALIKLRDVAAIKDDLSDFRQIARYNGKPAVGLGMIKVPNANTVEIVHEIERRLAADIRPNLPPGMYLSESYNEAPFIEKMVAALKEHLLEGTLLAALIVFLFMRSVSSTLMICLEIPVSLLGAIAAMYFAGYSFNSMTLLALLLLIGVVVDDAIVMRESILRHLEQIREQGSLHLQQFIELRNRATLEGSREVTFAVIAASFSLVCIFAPVIFMDGVIGKFFKAFGLVMTVGVLASLFVSLTLTPMLSARYLKSENHRGRFYDALDKVFSTMDRQYRSLITWSLHHRWKVMLVTAVTVLSSVYFIQAVDKEFAPEADESRFTISFKTPLGSSLSYTLTRLDAIEQILAKHSEDIASYFSVIGSGQRGQVNEGRISIRMHDRQHRPHSQHFVVNALKKELASLPGVRAFPVPSSMIRGQRSEILQFLISGPNIQNVGLYAKQIQQQLTDIDGFGKIDMDLQLDLPQLEMHVDRDRAAQLGISANDIASAVNTYVGGMDIASYNDVDGDGQRYDIRLKANENDIRSPDHLQRIFLRSAQGQLVRLDTLAKFSAKLGPAVIGRYDLQYAANLYASPSMPLAEAISHVEKVTGAILPADYQFKLSGQAEEFSKTFKNVGFIFGLAMILLYMVLASQFNSFLQPVLVMVAQPLAMVGGLFALWLTGQTLNIYSMIGLVLLIGLVAKNSILLIDLTNQYREQGMSTNEALLAACPVRLRPVLMTSLTIILALLPAALGLSAGDETNKPLSIAVIGGMISSTLLTLVVVPAFYSLVFSRKAAAT
ncbi:efflux RND transporter permease subunit [Methylophilus methylotrophus]|uniref:efflux RND transporter permease subunit n=1 Tax=Methylophilus methylotrophus TaxID=17 RepID=UPI00036F350A|nr:efflux RND transporter permease subunit [Methylophilus methylotrophus]